ncbi:MAG: CDP-glucose 4,6-dehydratase [Tatlockia sp.]|nr:CDP-glucose 4,6-dehydratase [Tatlockia sp.]
MSLPNFEQSLINKKILVTGHTGFTGGWACLWLQTIGAQLAGFSLPPETNPSLFKTLNLENSVPGTFADICDFDAVLKAVDSFQPDLILHLAAQPLVRRSYNEPVRTFAVNSQGTAHVLEAARLVKSVRGVLCVTTDKVYKNKEWLWPYREDDPLGGKDPYSASKAAAEMVIHSYAASYPWEESKGPAIAIARGGNIIGGGDWSEDRLIPDFVRALTAGNKLTLRYPEATRPWQHVLALVHGYLMLLAGLVSENPSKFTRAWNLGPQDPETYSVRDVLELMSECWERPPLEYMENPYPEAQALALDSSMAKALLRWNPVWNTKQVIAETAAWYRDFYANPESAKELTLNQINAWRTGI